MPKYTINNCNLLMYLLQLLFKHYHNRLTLLHIDYIGCNQSDSPLPDHSPDTFDIASFDNQDHTRVSDITGILEH